MFILIPHLGKFKIGNIWWLTQDHTGFINHDLGNPSLLAATVATEFLCLGKYILS